jgi:hypothetical protein
MRRWQGRYMFIPNAFLTNVNNNLVPEKGTGLCREGEPGY